MRRWLSFCLCALFLFAGPGKAETLAVYPGGEVDIEPYSLYLDVTEAMARYSARQAIVFSMVCYNYLAANGIALEENGFEAQAGEDMKTYLASDEYKTYYAYLINQYGMTADEIVQSVRALYWSQYIGQALSSFFTLEEKTAAQTAQEQFDSFEALFYQNLDLTGDDNVAVFAGEAVPWSDEYKALVRYNGAVSRIRTAFTIVENEAISHFLTVKSITPDAFDLDSALKSAVEQMHGDARYYEFLKLVLSDAHKTEEEFCETLKPFLTADNNRRALGSYCYAAYQADHGSYDSAAACYQGTLDALTEGATLDTLFVSR